MMLRSINAGALSRVQQNQTLHQQTSGILLPSEETKASDLNPPYLADLSELNTCVIKLLDRNYLKLFTSKLGECNTLSIEVKKKIMKFLKDLLTNSKLHSNILPQIIPKDSEIENIITMVANYVLNTEQENTQLVTPTQPSLQAQIDTSLNLTALELESLLLQCADGPTKTAIIRINDIELKACLIKIYICMKKATKIATSVNAIMNRGRADEDIH
ncbi:hypothetical protein FGO68_gene8320 [Halteria grandinella]|uniref:Uncharacterized protein n=1 Tax=Halteria grandinella TaxID=5974 RepID=A0A8J8NCX6_HALGN|nr:hypothetical protein FGO68_gene8320 [Halteria grandinella]